MCRSHNYSQIVWRDRQAWGPQVFMPNLGAHKNPKTKDPTPVKSGGMRWEKLQKIKGLT